MKLSMDFAFEGFRLIRKKPGLIVTWGLSMLLFMVVIFGAMFGLGGGAFMEMIKAGPAVDPNAILKFYAALLPAYAVIIPASIILGAVLQCAVFRAVLRPEQNCLGYFRLGSDEWRMMGLMFVLMVLWIIIEFVAAFGIGIVAGIMTTVVKGAVGTLISVIVGLLVFCGVIYLLVRSTTIAPHVYMTGKFDIGGGFALTKGKFWTLFLGFVVLGILYGLVIFLVEIIILALVAAVMAATGGGDALTAMAHGVAPAGSAMAGMAVSGLIIAVLVTGLMGAITAILYAPAPAAWRALRGDQA